MELKYVLAVITVISFIFNLILILDRRKRKGFDIDKELKLLEVKTEEIKAQYKQKRLKTKDDLAQRGIKSFGGESSIRELEMNKVDEEEKRELDKLNIEKEHLLKLKSYKFLGFRS